MNPSSRTLFSFLHHLITVNKDKNIGKPLTTYEITLKQRCFIEFNYICIHISYIKGMRMRLITAPAYLKLISASVYAKYGW
jgi:hypothetical protein